MGYPHLSKMKLKIALLSLLFVSNWLYPNHPKIICCHKGCDSLKTKKPNDQHTDMLRSNFQKSETTKSQNSIGRKTDFLMTKFDRVNVRSKPNINAAVLFRLSQNTKLIVLERHVSWYKIKVTKTGKIGFIHQYMVK